jgi:hypothetical protein
MPETSFSKEVFMNSPYRAKEEKTVCLLYTQFKDSSHTTFKDRQGEREEKLEEILPWKMQ